ncbi:Catechol O-methyltransferase [Penicillium digitatum PHI26]|uniref:Catechol O-methyltransferase n=2 Tax=Penicillium digitatum TaxID=36651 RepID=K9G5N4_PEND2|nr:Catechol O-methyltransferase [Penicillium digitatum Pd1]EKV16242.1 Catechol O-methyltransferase [Penicillium digitatum PHI26]EKV19454.1 Catechol O-methyltransferase [Penicillium digitatum Pd1]
MVDPEIFTKYPSLKKMQGLNDEDIFESHDGRELTLLRYIYNHPDLDPKLRGSPSAILDEALCESDAKLAEKLEFLNKEGTVVVADNVVRPGAPEYRRYMQSNPRLSESWGLPSLIIPVGFEDELEISVVGA